MEHDVFLWLASDNGFVVQTTIFILLVLGGMGFPIPEDIPLLLGGVAAAKEIAPLQTLFLVCYFGVMAGDQIVYFVGYFFGKRLVQLSTHSPFFPKVTEEKVEKVRENLRKHRLVTIFLARHLFPIRSVTFLVAGSLRIPFLEFLLADAFAAFVSVALMMAIGFYLGQKLTPEHVEHLARESHIYILGVVILILFMFLLTRFLRKRKKTKEEIPFSEKESEQVNAPT